MSSSRQRALYVFVLVSVVVLTGLAYSFLFLFRNPRDFNGSVSRAASLAVKDDPGMRNVLKSVVDYDAARKQFAIASEDDTITYTAFPVNPYDGTPMTIGDTSHADVMRVTSRGFAIRGVNGGNLLECPTGFVFEPESGICVKKVKLF